MRLGDNENNNGRRYGVPTQLYRSHVTRPECGASVETAAAREASWQQLTQLSHQRTAAAAIIIITASLLPDQSLEDRRVSVAVAAAAVSI